MLILAINTATQKTEIALLKTTSKNCSTLFERSWPSKRDEATKLLPAIEMALKKNKLQFTDLDQIICITGPGAYTGLRIGITTANAISYSINKPILALSTWQYLAAKVPTKMQKKTMIILRGAGNYYAVPASKPNQKPRLLAFHELLKIAHQQMIIQELNPVDLHELIKAFPEFKFCILESKKLNSFAAALQIMVKKSRQLTKKNIANIEPLYLQQPHITISKKQSFNQ